MSFCVKKDKKAHLETVGVMKYLLKQIEADCQEEGWMKGFTCKNGKQATLDRLVEIRRLALDLHHKIRGEY